MVVNNDPAVVGTSIGKFQGMDLISPLYLGGIPDFGEIDPDSGFDRGFDGCISRLVIGNRIVAILKEANVKVCLNSKYEK